MDIKVLGPGCAKCEQVEKLIKETIKELGVDAKVEKISDLMEIAQYGIIITPAVVIDNDVKVTGKVPSKEQIKSWFEK